MSTVPYPFDVRDWNRFVFNSDLLPVGVVDDNGRAFFFARLSADFTQILDPLGNVLVVSGGGGGSISYQREAVALSGGIGNLSQTPIAGSLDLYDAQGLHLVPTVDYSIVGTQITTAFTGPLEARYHTGSAANSYAGEALTLTGGGFGSATLSHAPIANSLALYDAQGLLLKEGTDYSLAGTTVTALVALGGPLYARYNY